MRFRKEPEDNFTLELTPLIDVVFLLLIFFMVSTVFVEFNRRMDLNLPASNSSILDERSESLEIEMTADKQIFLNGSKITMADLEFSITSAESAGEKKGKSALIRADKNLPYGDVIKVMGILQSAGIPDISVAVK